MPNCKSINLNNDDNILRHNGEEAHEGNPAWTSEIGLELTIVKIDQAPPPPEGLGCRRGIRPPGRRLEGAGA
ncbi:hypothetical protein KXW70_002851, partial [Aspergillus fumigatus]